MNTLQKTLLPNAILSALTGLLIAVGNDYLADIFQTSDKIYFTAVGYVIFVFGLTIFLQVMKPSPIGVLVILLQDFLWVVASLIVVITMPFNISHLGYLIIALYALPVIAFVWYQALALNSIDQVENSSAKMLSFSRIITADKQRVWEVISDVGNYSKVAPNIDKSAIISGDGIGMKRACSHGKDGWTEECTLWEEGHKYSFTVDTSAKDYPYPFKYLDGTWTVEEQGEMKSKLSMSFKFQHKNVIQNILIYPLLKKRFTKVCKELLDNWEEVILKRK